MTIANLFPDETIHKILKNCRLHRSCDDFFLDSIICYGGELQKPLHPWVVSSSMVNFSLSREADPFNINHCKFMIA